MLKPHQATKLRRLINNYAVSMVNDSWKGGGNPEEIPLIEAEFQADTKALFDFIKSVTVKLDKAEHKLRKPEPKKEK